MSLAIFVFVWLIFRLLKVFLKLCLETFFTTFDFSSFRQSFLPSSTSLSAWEPLPWVCLNFSCQQGVKRSNIHMVAVLEEPLVAIEMAFSGPAGIEHITPLLTQRREKISFET